MSSCPAGRIAAILAIAAACGEERSARLDGEPALAYAERGSGSPTFVLVPGARSGGIDERLDDWARLADWGRLLAYDARGCGDSPQGPSAWWTDHLDDLRRLIDQRSVGRVILVAGERDAAILALLFAYRHGSRISGLVLASASVWPGPYVAAPDTLPERTRARLDSLVRGDSVGELYRLDTLTAAPSAPDAAQARVASFGCPSLIGTLSEGRGAMPNFYDLAWIGHPVLIVRGESSSAALAALLPRSRYVTIPGAEGSPWHRAPEAFFEEVERFARQVEPSGTGRDSRAAPADDPSAPAAAPRWPLASELGTGGTYDDRLPFNEIVAAATDSAGSLHLLSRSPIGRWTVDPSGAVTRAEAPGPTGPLTAIGWTQRHNAAGSRPPRYRAWIREGDPRWATAARPSRLFLLGPEDAPSDTIAFVLPPTHPAYGQLQPAWLLADGTVLAEPGVNPSPGVRGWVRSVPVVRATPLGVVIDTLAQRPLRPERIVLRGDAGSGVWSSMVEHPFPSSAVAAIDPLGRWLTLVDPGPGGIPGTYRVARITLEGDTVAWRRNAYTPIEIPRRELDRLALDRYRESEWLHGETTPRRYRDAFVQAVGEIATYPTITGALASADGSVWVRREALPLATLRWTILDESGAEVADVQVPAAVELLAVAGRIAWGTRTTSWGPTLERYRVGVPPE